MKNVLQENKSNPTINDQSYSTNVCVIFYVIVWLLERLQTKLQFHASHWLCYEPSHESYFFNKKNSIALDQTKWKRIWCFLNDISGLTSRLWKCLYQQGFSIPTRTAIVKQCSKFKWFFEKTHTYTLFQNMLSCLHSPANVTFEIENSLPQSVMKTQFRSVISEIYKTKCPQVTDFFKVRKGNLGMDWWKTGRSMYESFQSTTMLFWAENQTGNLKVCKNEKDAYA